MMMMIIVKHGYIFQQQHAHCAFEKKERMKERTGEKRGRKEKNTMDRRLLLDLTMLFLSPNKGSLWQIFFFFFLSVREAHFNQGFLRDSIDSRPTLFSLV